MHSPASRARTIVATASSFSIGMPGHLETVLRHGVATDGSVLFLAPPGSPLAAGAAPAGGPASTTSPTISPTITASFVDVAPVPAADRVRGAVTLSGVVAAPRHRLPAALVAHLCADEEHPGRPVLELSPTTVRVDWRVEADPTSSTSHVVPPADYAHGVVDPLAGWEGGFVQHLHAHHADLLPDLLARLDVPVPPGRRLRPLLVDSRGLVVRATAPDVPGHQDVRLAFDRPVTCGCEAVEAFNQLLADH